MKNNWKKIEVVLFSTALILAACGDRGESRSDEKKYKIGVTQIVEHPSLNAAFDGFKKALEDAGLEVTMMFKLRKVIMSTNTTIADKLCQFQC